MTNKSYFILSSARSGSTSLAKILNTATNGICALEPNPNLNWETRELMERRLSNPKLVLENTVIPRVKKALEELEIYGEKNVTYGPFIPHLYEMLECKFILIKRDGRDVVRSLMDWHERMFGTIYRECKDSGDLSPQALLNAANLPIHLDTSDYARPRPLSNDPLFSEWENLTREEMCAYYWSFINNLYLDQLTQIPQDSWLTIDYTHPTADDIFKLVEFLGLEGLNQTQIQSMLDKKINSLQDRTGENNYYPNWNNWDSGLRKSFNNIASSTMQRLGYYQKENSFWKPINYGKWWCENEGGLDWYTWMYNTRQKMHTDMLNWLENIENQGESITSIVDFGCGVGVGYCDHFEHKRYVGVDLSPKNIQWCQENRKNPNHEYLCLDHITTPIKEKFDLVFSSGTIDNSYDIDQYLLSMVRQSRKWIYLTCYRGWFPDLLTHKYTWSEVHQCFYNDISPAQIRQTLINLGCQNVIVEPRKTGNQDIPYETRIIAYIGENNITQ